MIVPTVTAATAAEYREQLARVAPFIRRVHLDFSDGQFSPVKLINVAHAYWPAEIAADLHLMYRNPSEHLETVISLNPNLVIVHAEAQGNLLGMLRQLKAVRIKTGVAILQPTQPEAVRDLILDCDHVLIFSGNLGHFGGTADLSLLKKVAQIKSINPNAEIAWDGGINLQNVPQLVAGGVDVLNVGGAIQKADDPAEAYKALMNSGKTLKS